MKKPIISIISILCALSMLCSCGKKAEKTSAGNEEEKITSSAAENADENSAANGNEKADKKSADNKSAEKESAEEKAAENKKESQSKNSAVNKTGASSKKTIKSYEEILKDVSNIDIYYGMDKTGLKSETVYEEEFSSNCTYWKNSKGEKVYRTYEAHGDDKFDYFTKSESGNDIMVTYWGTSENREKLNINCDEYNIMFINLNKDDKYGADVICATAMEKANGKFTGKSVEYVYRQGSWQIEEVTTQPPLQ